MLIKSKIQSRQTVPEASVEVVPEVKPEVLAPALEDIDYVIAAQNFSDAHIGFENLQTDLAHGQDIAASLEQLDMVFESLKEIDLHDAAFIEAVGDIAGASCSIPGRLFTPSLEAAEEVGPSMRAKVKAIYEQIIKVVRMIVARVKAYFSYLFSDAHRLAKAFEKLGDKIRLFDYNTSQVVTIADMDGAPGGPKALITALAALQTAATQVMTAAPAILTAQLNYIYFAEKNGVDGVSADLQKIEQLSMGVGRGKTLSENGDETTNPVLVSKPYLNGLLIKAQVFDYDASGKDFTVDLVRRALSAQVGMVMSPEESTPRPSTFTLSHELAKDCYEALRPLVQSLVDPHAPNSCYASLRTLIEDGEKLDEWLHMRIKQSATAPAEDPRLLQLYEEGVKKIGGGQLAAIVRTHNLLDKAVTVAISYLDHCLKSPKIMVEKPVNAAPIAA